MIDKCYSDAVICKKLEVEDGNLCGEIRVYLCADHEDSEEEYLDNLDPWGEE